MLLPLKYYQGIYWFKQRFYNNHSYVAARHNRLTAARIEV